MAQYHGHKLTTGSESPLISNMRKKLAWKRQNEVMKVSYSTEMNIFLPIYVETASIVSSAILTLKWAILVL